MQKSRHSEKQIITIRETIFSLCAVSRIRSNCLAADDDQRHVVLDWISAGVVLYGPKQG
jgi:hypothetical protein